jgi:hypothetical protein
MDDQLKKSHKGLTDDDLGFLLWKFESIEDFLPYMKSIMKKEYEE